MSQKIYEHMQDVLNKVIENHINLIVTDKYDYKDPQQPKLLRDFNTINVSREKYNKVCVNAGDFAIMEASGSGYLTTWYLYHSPTYHKLFMIWMTNEHSGCRDDIQRIHFH